MSDHRQYREWAAAYVLGSLDPDERVAFESHLPNCEECRQEVISFAALPGLLGRVELNEATAPQRIVDMAAGTLRTEWEELHRSRARWRWAAALVAAVAALALLLPLAVPDDQSAGSTLVIAPGTSVSGTIVVLEKPWGTAVEIEVTGLPDRDSFVAWAVTSDGQWEQMAAWGRTPNSAARVAGASAVATGDLESVVITTDDRSDTVAKASWDA